MAWRINLIPNRKYMTVSDGSAQFEIELRDSVTQEPIANQECFWACFDKAGIFRSGSTVVTDSNGWSNQVVVPCPVSNVDTNWPSTKEQYFKVYAWPDPYPLPPSMYGKKERPGIPEDVSDLIVYNSLVQSWWP